MVWLDARGSFDRCHCPTRYILNVVGDLNKTIINKKQHKWTNKKF